MNVSDPWSEAFVKVVMIGKWSVKIPMFPGTVVSCNCNLESTGSSELQVGRHRTAFHVIESVGAQDAGRSTENTVLSQVTLKVALGNIMSVTGSGTLVHVMVGSHVKTAV
jgi:hypothetical protein